MLWFVTGAGRGLGRAFTEAALRRGDRVVATVRRDGALAGLAAAHPGRLFVRRLDVADRAAVVAVVDETAAAVGVPDVVVNNAGYGLVGAVEELSEAELRAQFDVNLFGAVWVTQAVLPHLRRRGSGRIVQVSTVGAVGHLPLFGAYNATKWALEAMSAALAEEVAPLGIRVHLLQLGGFATDWAGSSMRFATPDPAYTATREAILGQPDYPPAPAPRRRPPRPQRPPAPPTPAAPAPALPTSAPAAPAPAAPRPAHFRARRSRARRSRARRSRARRSRARRSRARRSRARRSRPPPLPPPAAPAPRRSRPRSARPPPCPLPRPPPRPPPLCPLPCPLRLPPTQPWLRRLRRVWPTRRGRWVARMRRSQVGRPSGERPETRSGSTRRRRSRPRRCWLCSTSRIHRFARSLGLAHTTWCGWRWRHAATTTSATRPSSGPATRPGARLGR
nr:hypothetical protein GCM10020092_025150 [Actinoplanes digitatis]